MQTYRSISIGSSLIFSAQGGRGKEKITNAAAEISVRSSEDEAEFPPYPPSASPEPKPRRPARSEQKPAKKFSFPFRRKNRGALNKKCEENFLAEQRAKRAAAGRSVQISQLGFSSKKVRILTKRYRQFSELGFWAIVASPSLRLGSASARILKGFLKSQNNFCPLKRKFEPIFFLSPLAKGKAIISNILTA